MELFIKETSESEASRGATSLDVWLTRFHGYVGTLTDRAGRKYTFTLESWRDRDPKTTWLTIGFRYYD
jgi:hypothetical protein